MKNKNFIKIGYMSLSLVLLTKLTGCTYVSMEEELVVRDQQKSIALVLGDTYQSTIYNVKNPQEVYLYAPSGYKILLGNEKKDYYKEKINPQEKINLKFKILKDGADIKEYKEVEKLVLTYKSEINPKNRKNLKTNDKYKHDIGEEIYFKLAPSQKEILIELHEYNKRKVHKFNYTNVKNDVRIRLIAPKYYSFVFNGKEVKQYEFNAKKDMTTQFDMTIKPDWDEVTYRRQYSFKMNK